MDSVQIFKSPYAAISFIENHPPPGTSPRDTTRRGQKPFPWDNHCVQNPSTQDKTGSQRPHPQDIKLENFTDVFINCLWHYLKWKAFSFQQIEQFSSEDSDC